MATVVTKYLNTDAAPDGDGSVESPWNTLNAAWNGIIALYPNDTATAGNLLIHDVQVEVLCSGTAPAPQFNRETSTGTLVQDATRFVRFKGDWDGLAYNSSQFRIETTTRCISLYLPNNYVKFENIQLKSTSSGDAAIVNMLHAGSFVEFTNVLLDASGVTGVTDAFRLSGAGSTIVLRNCAILLGASMKAGVDTGNASITTYALNCSIFGGERGYYKRGTAGSMVAINCGAAGQSIAGFETANTWGTGTDYNASEDTTAPGSNSQSEVDPTLAGDYQLGEADTAWAGKGTSLAQYAYPVVADIAGVDHSSPPDIGAWSLETEAAPVTADRLLIVQQPTTVAPGIPFALTVAATDAAGVVDVDVTDDVVLTLTATPAGGGTPTLGGTLTKAAVQGFAVFTDLELSLVGTGYKITATTAGLTPAQTAAFSVAASTPLPVGGAPTHSGGETVRPVTQQGTAAQRTIYFEGLDSDGAATTLTGPAQISIDGAAPVSSANNVIATGASGRHKLELSSGECDTLDRNIKVMPFSTAAFILGGEAHVVAGAVSAAPLTLATIASSVLDTVRGVGSLGTMIRRMFNKRDVVTHPDGDGKLQLRVFDDAGTTPILTEEITGAVSVTSVNPE